MTTDQKTIAIMIATFIAVGSLFYYSASNVQAEKEAAIAHNAAYEQQQKQQWADEKAAHDRAIKIAEAIKARLIANCARNPYYDYCN
jgi:hypothetical protein